MDGVRGVIGGGGGIPVVGVFRGGGGGIPVGGVFSGGGGGIMGEGGSKLGVLTGGGIKTLFKVLLAVIVDSDMVEIGRCVGL